MNFLLHNRIEISNGKDTVYFYNRMLNSVFSQLQLKKSFNDYIALGTGNSPDESIANCKLKNYLKTYKLDCEFLQDDISKGTLYIKKAVVIDDEFLNNKILCEAGITNSTENNPTIFNYFQFIDENQVVGIVKQRGVPLVISIYIYLDISKSPNYSGLITEGKNKFIDFLLGNGLEDEIYSARGNLFIDNSESIERSDIDVEKYPCSMNIESSQNELQITFRGDLGVGPATEVLMLVGNSPFARILTVSSNDVLVLNDDFSVKSNKVVEIDDNVYEITSVVNNSTHVAENSYYENSSAYKFGDRVCEPFNNLFDASSSRFVSKDGKMIFFVVDDKVYGYIDEKYKLTKLNTSAIKLQNIVNIVAFEKLIFVVTKNSQYLHAYTLQDDIYSVCEIDFTNFDKQNIISNIFKCDITISQNNKIMFGVIDKINYYGWTFYFDFDEQNEQIVYDNYLSSENRFNYVLSMYKTNFNDAMTIFLKADTLSYLCKIVYHYADKTYQDIYSTLAYYLTYDTKEIYTSSRAIVVEQLSSPMVWIYLYPNITAINLNVCGTEIDDYISTNLKYLFQKFDDGTYKFYNLVGYDTPTEFLNGLPSEIQRDKIVDFAFLDDIVLIFLNDENQKMIALSLLESKKYIENISSNTDTYNISYKKYNIAGENNKKVIANFLIRITL